LFQQFFGLGLYANLSIDLIVHFIENVTVVLTIFLPWIIAHLSIDLIVFLFETLTVVSTIFLAMDSSQTIHRLKRSFT